MPSAKDNLANAEKLLGVLEAKNDAMGSKLIQHKKSFIELRADVDRTADVVIAQGTQLVVQQARITQIGDNQDGLDQRVTGLEALNHEIDWERSAVITAVVAVISAFIIYTLVFSLRWDPLLEIEGGTIDGEISDAARSIMNWHVAIFTFVVTAFTFFGCVCFIAKRKPGSTTTTTAPAEQPTQVVRVVEVVEVAEPLTAPVPPSRAKSLDWVAPAQAQ